MQGNNETTTVEYDTKIYQNYLNELQKYKTMEKKFQRIHYISVFLISIGFLGFFTSLNVILQFCAFMAGAILSLITGTLKFLQVKKVNSLAGLLNPDFKV